MPYCIQCGTEILEGEKCRECSGQFIPLAEPETPFTVVALKSMGILTCVAGFVVAAPMLDNEIIGLSIGIAYLVGGFVAGLQLFALGLIVDYLASLKSYERQRGC